MDSEKKIENKIKEFEFDDEGKLIAIKMYGKAKDFKKVKKDGM